MKTGIAAEDVLDELDQSANLTDDGLSIRKLENAAAAGQSREIEVLFDLASDNGCFSILLCTASSDFMVSCLTEPLGLMFLYHRPDVNRS